MICPTCKTENIQGARICGNCGNHLEEVTAVMPTIAEDYSTESKRYSVDSAIDPKQAKKAAKAAKKAEKKQDKGQKKPAFFRRKKNCTSNQLGYELLRLDGVMRVKKGMYARCIHFTDVNYQGARQSTQLTIHEKLVELINTFDANAGFQWYLESRRLNKEEFQAKVHFNEVPGEDLFNRFRREQNMIIESQAASTNQNVERDLHIVIWCYEDDMEHANAVLRRLCSTVESKLRDVGCAVRLLDGTEWLNLINRVTNPGDPQGSISYEDLAANYGLRTADLIAPPSMEKIKKGVFKSGDGFRFGDYYAQTLYVQKYSNSVRDDFLSRIVELPYNITTSLHVVPIDQNDAKDLAETKLMDLKAEKRNYILDHPHTAAMDEEMLPGSLGDNIISARQTREDLVKNDQHMFVSSIVFMVYDQDVAMVDEAVDEIKRMARGYTYRIASLEHLQIASFKSCLPVANYGLPYERRIMTAPLANFVPFTSDELMQPGGMYMGQNLVSKNSIFYDRVHAVAPNGFILGKPGRGKSVTAKLQILWALLTDPTARVIVLDPESEYGTLCAALGGQMVKLNSASTTHLNPLDITDLYAMDEDGNVNDPLTLKSDFVITMVEMMTRSLTEVQKTIIDRACGIIYARYFETHDPNDMPTLQTLYETIKAQPEDEAQAVALTMERYVTGSMSIFNNRTNIDYSNRLIVFDIKDMGKNLQPLGLLILLDQTWNFITSGREDGSRTWFFTDELQLLFPVPSAVKFYDELYTRSRKWGAIPTGITQNVKRALEVPAISHMISNSDYLIILQQSANDAKALADVLDLSDQQMSVIRNADVAEGLLVADGKIINYKNEIPRELNGKPTETYQMITTKLDDIIEMKAAS